MFPYRVIPNPIFKITIYYTRQTNNTKILSKFLFFFRKKRKVSKTHFLFCYMYTFHNSYFVNFVIVGFLVIWVILYILYYTCRSLTRVRSLVVQSNRNSPIKPCVIERVFDAWELSPHSIVLVLLGSHTFNLFYACGLNQNGLYILPAPKSTEK